MAYTKTTWNNLSNPPINAENLNKIEQGIYDNSLGIDKINPSGTATATAEIEEGQINDVIGFKSLKLNGQTSQYTTQGNNLLNIYARHPSGYTETVSGVTITYNDDGSVSANGTATADINYFLASKAINGDNVFNGTHYLSGCSGGSATTFFLQFWADTVGTYPQTTTEVATNKTSGVNWNIIIGIKNGVTINKTFYPMMCATSGKSFEPYTNGASPNPDYPQDINNVSGDNVVRISNKNLIEYSFKGYNINSQGKFETGGTSLDFDVHIAYVKAGTTYTITPATNVIAYFDEKPTITSQAYNNSREVITSTNRLTPTRSGYIAMRTATSNTAQLEKGSSATSYIAHQGNDFEINLGKNLFNKDDNTLIFNGFPNGATNKLQSDANAKTIFIPCQPNKKYTISKTISARFIIADTSSDSIVADINVTMLATTANVASHTITTSANAKYLLVFYYLSSADTLSEEEIRNSIQIEVGSQATSYADYFPPIELCKISTYQDYIYKKDGKWWKHKEIGKKTLNGSETWTRESTTTSGKGRFQINLGNLISNNIVKPSSNANAGLILSDLFIAVVAGTNGTYGCHEGISLDTNGYVQIYNETQSGSDVATFKTWLANNSTNLYWVYSTPIEEEITYTPLIRQLDELYNSGLYDVTNISQDNSSEAFILDIEACKNNINGIVEYIRR